MDKLLRGQNQSYPFWCLCPRSFGRKAGRPASRDLLLLSPSWQLPPVEHVYTEFLGEWSTPSHQMQCLCMSAKLESTLEPRSWMGGVNSCRANHDHRDLGKAWASPGTHPWVKLEQAEVGKWLSSLFEVLFKASFISVKAVSRMIQDHALQKAGISALKSENTLKSNVVFVYLYYWKPLEKMPHLEKQFELLLTSPNLNWYLTPTFLEKQWQAVETEPFMLRNVIMSQKPENK